MAMDIELLIFTIVFKIPPSVVTQYSSVGDKLLYLIIIPHIILFMLLVFISDIIPIVNQSNFFKNLFRIVGYIYFVYSGWYGTWFLKIALAWWIVTFVAFAAIFFLRWFFPYEKIFSSSHWGFVLGRKLRDKLEDKGIKIKKRIDSLRKDLKKVNREIRAFGVKIDENDEDPNNENILRVLEELRKGGNEKALEVLTNLVKKRLEIIAEIKELEAKYAKKTQI